LEPFFVLIKILRTQNNLKVIRETIGICTYHPDLIASLGFLLLGVPKEEWVTVYTKESEKLQLHLEFSSVLTNVWQLRVTPFLNSSVTSTVHVEFELVGEVSFVINCH